MNEEMETVLRRSLDEVDRVRKRQWVYLALAFALLVFFLLFVLAISRRIADPYWRPIYATVGMELFFGTIITLLTNILVILGLSLFINRMTNKILKAIDLLAKQ